MKGFYSMFRALRDEREIKRVVVFFSYMLQWSLIIP